MTARRLPLLAALLLSACSPGRTLVLDFHADTTGVGAPPVPVSDIASVDIAVFDGKACRCVDLDVMPGCMTTRPGGGSDIISSFSFTAARPERTEGAFPDGALVVRVYPHDAATPPQPVPMKIDCGCAFETAIANLALVFTTGSPRDPVGKDCPAAAPN